jgi:hypothetical protein
MKAHLTPLGSIKGDTWERIYDYTVDDEAAYRGIYFDGSGDALSTAGTSDLQFGSGDFQVKVDIFIDSISADRVIVGKGGGYAGWAPDYGHEWLLSATSSGKLRFQFNENNGSAPTTLESSVVTLVGSWHNIEYNKVSGNYSLVLDGTTVGSGSGVAAILPKNTNQSLVVGVDNGGSASYKGWIKNLTITKVSSLVLDIKGDEALGTTTFADSSQVGRVIATSNNCVIKSAGGATSLTISGLNGDVDEEYILESKVVGGCNVAVGIDVRINNDSGNNYGFQYIDGSNASPSAGRVTNKTGIDAIGSVGDLGNISLTSLKLFAKSGFVRTCILERLYNASGATISSAHLNGQSWNNTADNITSLVIAASQTGGIGVGSSFQLYRKTRRS